MNYQPRDPKLLNLIYELWGKVLQTCIELETIMDAYIAEHFCQSEDKIVELASIVLAPRVSWGDKLAIFSVLIEKYNKPFMNTYPDFNKDIQRIIEHRTVFAHYPANTTRIGVKLFKEEKIVAFYKFKNSRMPKTKEIVYNRQPSYTENEINLILKGITTYTIAIHNILKPLR
jgi:hypothetical protein